MAQETLQLQYSKDIIYYHLSVKDLDAMKNFYGDILEFEFASEAPPEFGWCDFKLPVEGTRLGLLRSNQDLKPGNTTSLNVSVNNLADAKAMLEAKGVTTTDIQDVPDMISMFDIFDPEGNKVTFLSIPRVQSKQA